MERIRLIQELAEFNINKRCKEMNYILIKPFIYENNKIKLFLKCKKDNYEWIVNYNRFINNKSGCPMCGGNPKITQEIANEIVLKKCKEKNYTLVKSFLYTNNKTRLTLRCNIDSYEWNVSYSNFISNNRGCPKCSNIIKITQAEADLKINEICKKKNYELVEPFILKNSFSKIHLRCNIDNNEWFSYYNNFILKNSGCRKCAGTLKLTQNEVENKINERCLENNYELIKPIIYKNAKSKINLRCNLDGYEWNVTYNNFVNCKQGCPKCNNVAKVTQEIVDLNINKRCIEMNYELVEPFIYKIDQTKFKIKCKNCNHIWIASYNNFIYKETGCPKCNQSKGERKIMNYLNNKNIKFIREYRFDNCINKRKLPFDFYLPDNNICIEYDGEQHFKLENCWGGEEELIRIKERDKIKTDYCLNNKIELIRIRYDEKVDDILNKKLILI